MKQFVELAQVAFEPEPDHAGPMRRAKASQLKAIASLLGKCDTMRLLGHQLSHAGLEKDGGRMYDLAAAIELAFDRLEVPKLDVD